MVAADDEWEASEIRNMRVAEIFKQFDCNCDGRLNRDEMAALVVAVNPRVKFNELQIAAILDEVFRTYGEFIEPATGLSLEGLRRTYDDGAGDVDRDFTALGLTLVAPPPKRPPALPAAPEEDGQGPAAAVAAAAAPAVVAAQPESAAPATFDGFKFESTRALVEDLAILLKRHSRGMPHGAPQVVEPSAALSADLREFRQRTELLEPDEARAEGHLATGRQLVQHRLYADALPSLQRAVALQAGNARAHFLCGSVHQSLGQPLEARAQYDLSLSAAAASDPASAASVLPQVHVNYGILVEEEGLLLAACEHYRAAAALNPQHFRALKLLGSALFGVGEARPAEEALARALALNGAYADARCELGSVLHALGEDTPAEAEFGRALELEPGHEAAQYNLAGLLRDSGQYARALQEYEKLLARAPGHWRARLNYAVAQMGAGFHEAAQASMRQVLRSQRRVEVYDALAQLDRLARTDRHLGAALEKGGGGGPHVPYVVARPDQLACATEATTPAAALATALEVRSFQRRTRLGACPVMSLKAELVGGNAKVVPKSTMEALLRRLLPALTPEPFQAAVKALNERVLTVLDPQGASQVPLGPALAAMALLCAGGVAERCHVAYEALCWHSGGTPGQLARAEADAYLGSLSRMYLPSVSGTGPQGAGGFAAESGVVSHADFTALLLQELPVLETLSKLESCDRERHNGLHCCVCSCPVVGPRFRETRAHFSLCSFCYSERKVPAAVQRAEYQFREYTKSPVLLRDKFKVKAPPRGAQAAEEGVGAH